MARAKSQRPQHCLIVAKPGSSATYSARADPIKIAMCANALFNPVGGIGYTGKPLFCIEMAIDAAIADLLMRFCRPAAGDPGVPPDV
jgi:hypothetical protein